MKDRKDFFAQLVRKHSGFPDVAVDGRTLEYTGFLASEALADLKDLATSIQIQIAVVDNFVAGPAADYAEKKYTDAGELILNESVQPASLPFGSTRVLFVHGNAGSGKTALLRHITRLQRNGMYEAKRLPFCCTSTLKARGYLNWRTSWPVRSRTYERASLIIPSRP